jgi:hypothetical protein
VQSKKHIETFIARKRLARDVSAAMDTKLMKGIPGDRLGMELDSVSMNIECGKEVCEREMVCVCACVWVCER